MLRSITVSAMAIIVLTILSVISVRFFLYENIQGQRILDQIDESVNVLHNSLIDQETGQRGYNLTNNPSFLEPYYQGMEDFSQSSKALAELMIKYPSLTAEIEELIEKGEYWHHHYGEPLVEMSQQGEAPSLELLSAGKQALDDFRLSSEVFFQHIEAERTVVREKMQTGIQITLVSLVISIIAIVCINVYINYRVLKSVVRPIIHLNDCVTAYTKHDFSKKIPVYERKDELSELIRNVDQMREELSSSFHTLKTEANADGLTGLFNRRYFDEYLEREWNTAKKEQKCLSLILFDIDYFKNYNDTYGHLEGDECLKKISHCLRTFQGGSLNFAARYGGEEFAVILINRTEQETRCIAEGMRQAVMDLNIPHASSDICDYVTISIGVATVIPTDRMEINDFIHMADQALYLSKKNGRNQVTMYRPGAE